KHCGNWSSAAATRHGLRPTTGSGGFEVRTKEKVSQEHVFLIASGPPADDPLCHAADTLALAVGDHSRSPLYRALVDPGLVDSADMGFHEYQGTGAFFASFNGDPERAEENLATVLEVLRDVQKNGITEEELAQAKSKIGSRVVRGSERPMGRMQA